MTLLTLVTRPAPAHLQAHGLLQRHFSIHPTGRNRDCGLLHSDDNRRDDRGGRHAYSRFNVDIGPGTLVPELENESFGAIITSDEYIVVERAMYSNANGQIWAAGTNATAAPLP